MLISIGWCVDSEITMELDNVACAARYSSWPCCIGLRPRHPSPGERARKGRVRWLQFFAPVPLSARGGNRASLSKPQSRGRESRTWYVPFWHSCKADRTVIRTTPVFSAWLPMAVASKRHWPQEWGSSGEQQRKAVDWVCALHVQLAHAPVEQRVRQQRVLMELRKHGLMTDETDILLPFSFGSCPGEGGIAASLVPTFAPSSVICPAQGRPGD
ncbi:hypothetical protein BU23DRAFT_207247 [Bimuria novae-zelandiae CBS 107.79]|uniref:Uncharacterized protein n=1 Tax=Bimuria novae-zelandiae CBS 107.79 TaxID=1447943 RepID=A0A6A5V351_9PLEO|nr:hypothetical protein BU23DRAFT_207247 [Bimuria novae-zelandiae CBS 107.79]